MSELMFDTSFDSSSFDSSSFDSPGFSKIKVSKIKKIKKIKKSWKNKTSGRSKTFIRSIKKQQFTKLNNLNNRSERLAERLSLVPRKFFNEELGMLSFSEANLRKELGKVLYLERGELIKSLSVSFNADRWVIFNASINQLRVWFRCYLRLQTLRTVSKFK